MRPLRLKSRRWAAESRARHKPGSRQSSPSLCRILSGLTIRKHECRAADSADRHPPCRSGVCAEPRSRHKPGDKLARLTLAGHRAETDVGARCYDSGSCDLPFTSPSLDPEAISDHLTRRFQDAGGASEAGIPFGSPSVGLAGIPGRCLNFSDDAAIPGTSRYWHCAWLDAEGNVANYHLKTVRMKTAVGLCSATLRTHLRGRNE